MNVGYDKYYQTQNLFGEPYPELLNFYSNLSKKGKLLDLGCGQGRDAIALARLGFEVTGIDYSKVGIEQLNQVAENEQLPLIGLVADINTFSDFNNYDFILLDSMFHFGKKDKRKEINFLKKVFECSKLGTLITICIQKTGDKLQVLEKIIVDQSGLKKVNQQAFIYTFKDKASNHKSKTTYEMITVRK